MGDPFTIAVSVAGLTSLGIQLAQGLKKYADSALDSKGRILAISIDIELAVQVIKTLDATLQNTSNRVSLSDDARKLSEDVIEQCQGLFDAIKRPLPDLEPISLKKMDMIKWPTIESKVELFRSNLDKIKLTLQLLMSVMIYAAICSSAPQPESLEQQRLEIRRLQEEEAIAEARLTSSRLQHDELLAPSEPQVNMVNIQSQDSGANKLFKPMHCIEGGSVPSMLAGHDTNLQNDCQPQHQPPSTPSCTSPVGLRKIGMSASRTNKGLGPSLASKSRMRDFVTKFLGTTRQSGSTSPSSTVAEFEDPMQMLYHDYGRCLEQLSTLQAAIGVTSQISFRSEGDRVYGCRDAALTFELIDKVKWHGECTMNCLKACLMDSMALRKIEQQAKASRHNLPRDSFYKASYAEYLTRPEETQVVGGIPRAKSSGAPVVLKFEPEPEVIPSLKLALDTEFCGLFSFAKSASTQPVHESPSVDDLVSRWTTIRSNDASAEPGAFVLK